MLEKWFSTLLATRWFQILIPHSVAAPRPVPSHPVSSPGSVDSARTFFPGPCLSHRRAWTLTLRDKPAGSQKQLRKSRQTRSYVADCLSRSFLWGNLESGLCAGRVTSKKSSGREKWRLTVEEKTGCKKKKRTPLYSFKCVYLRSRLCSVIRDEKIYAEDFLNWALLLLFSCKSLDRCSEQEWANIFWKGSGSKLF